MCQACNIVNLSDNPTESNGMNYEKALAKHGLGNDEIEQLVEVLARRAEAADGKAQPKAIYHSAAIDLMLGACEMCEEVQAGMKDSTSAKTWLSILTGVSF